jgi:hypothetical protein
MPRYCKRTSRITLFICLCVGTLRPVGSLAFLRGQEPVPRPAGPSGGVPGSEPKYRLLRAVAGTKSHEQDGRLVIDDPRTVFSIPADQKVIVYFEWEGAPGTHHLEGFWKNPEGKIVVMSDFNYEAKQMRFGAYWTLTISEGLMTGLWALEARVDGEVAGVQTFQIVAGPPSAEASVKKLPSRAEIYKLATGATLDVQRLNATGEVLGTGSAFVVKDGVLLTAYDVIDCAKSLRVVLPDGKQIEAPAILAGDRPQDWVLLQVPPFEVAPLQVAKPDSWAVGDEYFSLDVPASGGRTLIEGTITGTNDFPDFGKRLHLSFSTSPKASGSPVLNEAGEVIGIMSHGSLLPGIGSIDGFVRIAYPMNLAGVDSPARLNDVLAVPITSVHIPEAGAQPIPLEQFVQAGGLIPPLTTGERIIDFGTLALRVIRQGPVPQTEGERFQYSRRDGQIVVFLSVLPNKETKSQLVCRLYDLRNHLVGQTQPVKLNLGAFKRSYSWWSIDISTLRDGLYRADVFIGEQAAWRTFFRLTP